MLNTTMDYSSIYDQLIERGKTRILEGYTEKHHIIPRCMGGSNDTSNLVDLCPREHFIAHVLLSKIHPENHSLMKAVSMMTVGHGENRSKNRMYGWMKRRFSEAQSVCQGGKLNSQYGTRWIYDNDTLVNKKISNDLPTPEGWSDGRKLVAETKKAKRIRERAELTSKKRAERAKKYSEYLEIYNEVGFSEFVNITQYKYSQANLVERFASLLPNFKPQNGKKRGK